MKPDITLTDEDGEIAAILDAKWKVIDPTQKKLGLSQSDLYQVTSYALRYGCDRVALVYPTTAGISERVAFTVPETSIQLELLFVDLVASSHESSWSGWDELLPVAASPGSIQ